MYVQIYECLYVCVFVRVCTHACARVCIDTLILIIHICKFYARVYKASKQVYIHIYKPLYFT